MLLCLVQIISTLIPDVSTIFRPPCWCTTPIWRFHTGLCKFLRNISMNLGKRTDLKLGEVSLYNIKISWLHALNVFRFVFYCVTVKTIYLNIFPLVNCAREPILYDPLSKQLEFIRCVLHKLKNKISKIQLSFEILPLKLSFIWFSCDVIVFQNQKISIFVKS